MVVCTDTMSSNDVVGIWKLAYGGGLYVLPHGRPSLLPLTCLSCGLVGSRMYRYPALELKVPTVWHDHQLMAAQLKMKNIYFTGHPLVVRLRRDNGQRSSLLLYDDMQDELPVVDYWRLDLVGGNVHFVSCGDKPLRMVFPVRVDWCGMSLLFIVHIMGHVPPSNRRRIEWSTDEHPQTENFGGQVMFC
ncbi:hypothetical protein QAD02_014821 [Eretmocerus hayati]|uniref:Uncharacterized protein n=1 Tax=Eretmocerus hayati TaxID=131215 RepID=A0ACC2P6Y7_9HYME|nr:hypothetical protein QAD02_014821 [Eretmocerus hayati]